MGTCTSAESFVLIGHSVVPKRFIHSIQLQFGTNDSDSASSMISSDGWLRCIDASKFLYSFNSTGVVVDSCIWMDLWMTSPFSRHPNKSVLTSCSSAFTSLAQDTRVLFFHLFCSISLSYAVVWVQWDRTCFRVWFYSGDLKYMFS